MKPSFDLELFIKRLAPCGSGSTFCFPPHTHILQSSTPTQPSPAARISNEIKKMANISWGHRVAGSPKGLDGAGDRWIGGKS